ncbi:GxxExxY protein [Trichloromonas sp.]|uniref:GxxExxY protein n=1 Tax=Trichloromonas sp. TaxID=3069249 RepID=UPI002A37B102|nr:GxxExxY protein [Trichloromonas sp.]
MPPNSPLRKGKPEVRGKSSRIQVNYKGTRVGDYVADIVVEDVIVIELKSVKALDKSHEAQLLNYLKATGYSVGLLVNFTHPKAEIRRFVF